MVAANGERAPAGCSTSVFGGGGSETMFFSTVAPAADKTGSRFREIICGFDTRAHFLF